MLILVQYEQSELPNPVKYVRDTEYESIAESIDVFNWRQPIGLCAMPYRVTSGRASPDRCNHGADRSPRGGHTLHALWSILRRYQLRRGRRHLSRASEK